MNRISKIPWAGILVFVLAAIGAAQDRFFVSSQWNVDPARMTPARTITMNDPLFVVIDLTKTDGTIENLLSTNQKTGEKNLFLCLDMNTASMKYTCLGLLKPPFSEAVLKSKSYAYTLIPQTNDLNFENIDATELIFHGLSYAFGDNIELKLSYKNMDTGNEVELRPQIDLRDRDNSRWKKLADAIDAQKAARKRQQQLAASETEPLPSSLLNDPATEKEVFELAQAQFRDTHRVYKVALIDRDWSYYRNEFGIVTGRGSRVAFLMKRIANSECEVHYTMYAKQDHIAGGRFSRTMLRWRDNTNDWKPVKCQKFTGFQ
ncbi:MAG: hypothetical protein ACT4OT_08370 [Acidobacteriota bacterium]